MRSPRSCVFPPVTNVVVKWPLPSPPGYFPVTINQRHGRVLPCFWCYYYITTIAMPPPSRVSPAGRPQVARGHMADHNHNVFCHGKCSLSQQCSIRIYLFSKIWFASPPLRVPATQFRSQAQQQRRGRLCVLFSFIFYSEGTPCLALTQKITHLHLYVSLNSHKHPTLTSTFYCACPPASSGAAT